MHITLPKGRTFFVFCAIFIILIAGCPTPGDDTPISPDPVDNPDPVDTATPPGTMVAPTLTAGNGQLEVTWTEPDDGGSAITAYHLRHSADGGSNWSDIINVDAPATSGIITGLDNGTSYIVQALAVNAEGDGEWSPSSAEGMPVHVPLAPTGLALTVGNGELTATWEAPTDTGGSAITGYEVQYRTSSSPKGMWLDSSNSGDSDVTDTNHDITGLTNGTEYEVRVYAVNDQGDGNPSDIAAATPATEPNAIRIEEARIFAGGQHSIFLIFPVLTEINTGGSEISQYDLQYKKSDDNDTKWTELTDITVEKSGGDIFTTIDSTAIQDDDVNNPLLEAGTSYDIEVRAVNAIGAGDWSATVNVTTVSSVKPDAPGSFEITAGDESIVVTWTVPYDGGSPITSYTVQYGDPHLTNPQSIVPGVEGIAGDELRVDAGYSGDAGDALTYTITRLTNDGPGLHNGKTYRVYMFASNDIGSGVGTVKKDATPIGPPKAPTGLALTVGNDAQLGVGWIAPTDTGGLTITGYELEYKLSSGAWDTSADVTQQEIASATPPVPTTDTIAGLTNGSAYDVRVRAVNSEGAGDWSTSAAATPATIPDKIVVSGTPVSTRYSISLSWVTPDNNGSVITGYDLRYKQPVAPEWTELTDITLNADNQSFTLDTESIRADDASNPILLAGVAGTAYNIAVRAVNAQGNGLWSDTASVTTQAEDSGSTKPAQISNFAITAGVGQIEVAWTAPTDDGGSEITGYLVTYGDLSSDDSTLVVGTTTSVLIPDGSATTHTIMELANGKYGVYMRAYNRIGSGDPTDLEAVDLGS